MRRSVVTSVALALLLVTSGCVGMLSGPVTFTASEATVSDSALQDTGYEKNRTTEMSISRTFSAAGQSKDVKVTNWVSEYHQSVGIPGLAEQKVAVFATFSSPKVEVVGKSFNPLDKYNNRQLAQKFTAKFKNVDIKNEVGNRKVTMLGNETSVSKYEATVTTVAGVQFDAYLHVTKVKHGDDHVVALAVYPKQLSDHDQKVDRLIEGVEHEK